MDTLTQFDILLKDFFNSDKGFATLAHTKVGYPVDIYQDRDGLHFEIACTGIDREDMNIQVEGDILRISYEKPVEETGKSPKEYLYRSISRRSFNLGYRLPGRFDLASIKAKFHNGLLTIHIPLKTEAKPKTVTIE